MSENAFQTLVMKQVANGMISIDIANIILNLNLTFKKAGQL